MDPNSGEFIKEQLERFGSDVDREHEISFWLYFETKAAAETAYRQGLASGLSGEVALSAVPDRATRWLCLLMCPHIPDEYILNRVFEFCTRLAHICGGHFDGWEARLELEDGHIPEVENDNG